MMVWVIIFVGSMLALIITCLSIKPKRKWDMREWERDVFNEEEF